MISNLEHRGYVHAGHYTPEVVIEHPDAGVLVSLFKGVRTRMFSLIIYLPCFDPCVLFCCLVFCSVLPSTERDKAQPLPNCSNRAPLYFCVLVRLRTSFKTEKPLESRVE